MQLARCSFSGFHESSTSAALPSEAKTLPQLLQNWPRQQLLCANATGWRTEGWRKEVWRMEGWRKEVWRTEMQLHQQMSDGSGITNTFGL